MHSSITAHGANPIVFLTKTILPKFLNGALLGARTGKRAQSVSS